MDILADKTGNDAYAIGDLKPALSHDGGKLALLNTLPGIVDVETGRHESRMFPGGVANVVFSPDDQLLATSNLDSTACIIDAKTGAVLHKLQLRAHAPSIAFSPDGRTLATGAIDGDVTLWHVATGHELARFPTQAARVCKLQFSADGETLAGIVVDDPTGNAYMYRWSCR